MAANAAIGITIIGSSKRRVAIETYDVIVIGLGGVGSAALYQLAGRRQRVLGLDQLEPPHALGSSHGDSRITRQALGENVPYSPLALRSHEIWRELERETGDELLIVTGGLIMAPDQSSEIFHGTSAFLDQTIAAARNYRIVHELLGSRDIARRFPQFQLVGSEVGYYEPGAGVLRPELCVAAHLKQAAARGASLRTNERVVALEAGAGEATIYVQTDHETYEASTVVLAAGPWVASFAPPAWRRDAACGPGRRDGGGASPAPRWIYVIANALVTPDFARRGARDLHKTAALRAASCPSYWPI
jgi:sarcosine oxidase